MNAETCLKKLECEDAPDFAAADRYGAPQIRNISAIHCEPDAMHFFSAMSKDFCQQLLSDGRAQIPGCGSCRTVRPAKAAERRGII